MNNAPSTHHGGDVEQVRCAVLTASDSRDLKNDEGGDTVCARLKEHGHVVIHRDMVKDDIDAIRQAVMDRVDSGMADAVVITGGTGIATRDVTPEALQPLLTRSLPGFGEAFRQISLAEVGPQAMLSRATAGVIGRTVVFALPGSPEGCRLAVDKLIAPVLRHVVGLLRAR